MSTRAVHCLHLASARHSRWRQSHITGCSPAPAVNITHMRRCCRDSSDACVNFYTNRYLLTYRHRRPPATEMLTSVRFSLSSRFVGLSLPTTRTAGAAYVRFFFKYPCFSFMSAPCCARQHQSPTEAQRATASKGRSSSSRKSLKQSTRKLITPQLRA